MNFNEAITKYQMIQRKGWNGKGMFVFAQVPSEIPIAVVPKMQSLPEDVMNEFMNRLNKASDNQQMTLRTDNPLLTIRYDKQMCIVNSDNTINGWAPSVSDALAEDWHEYVPTN